MSAATDEKGVLETSLLLSKRRRTRSIRRALSLVSNTAHTLNGHSQPGKEEESVWTLLFFRIAATTGVQSWFFLVRNFDKEVKVPIEAQALNDELLHLTLWFFQFLSTTRPMTEAGSLIKRKSRGQARVSGTQACKALRDFESELLNDNRAWCKRWPTTPKLKPFTERAEACRHGLANSCGLHGNPAGTHTNSNRVVGPGPNEFVSKPFHLMNTRTKEPRDRLGLARTVNDGQMAG